MRTCTRVQSIIYTSGNHTSLFSLLEQMFGGSYRWSSTNSMLYKQLRVFKCHQIITVLGTDMQCIASNVGLELLEQANHHFVMLTSPYSFLQHDTRLMTLMCNILVGQPETNQSHEFLCVVNHTYDGGDRSRNW